MKTKIALGVLLVIILILGYKFIYVAKISSSSMSPTFKKNEKIVYLKKNNLSIKKKDVVIFNYRSSLMVKRVMAIPGDTLFLKNDLFHRKLSDLERPMSSIIVIPSEGFNLKNNEEIIKYSRIIESIENKLIVVKAEVVFLGDKVIDSYVFSEDLFFVEGDSRFNSIDSRSFGLIPRSSVLGSFLFKLY